MVRADTRKTPRAESTDALPPNDLAAERAVLGACMLDGEAIDTAGLWVTHEHFYAERHGVIFRTMVEMRTAGIPVDAVTLAERLESAGSYNDVGGVPYILEILDTVPHAAHVEYYAKIVLDRSRRRLAMSAGYEILRTVGDLSSDTGDILAAAERKIHTALEHGTAIVDTSIGAALLEAITNCQEQRQPGLQLQMPSIDAILGDVMPGNVVVLAARPSVGKTSVVTTVMRKLAEVGIPGCLYSYEMTRLEIASRMICTAACLRMDQVQRNRLSGQEQDRLLNEAAILGRLPLYIDDEDRTLPSLLASIRVMVRRHRVRVVAIDYLQEVPTGERFQVREQEIAHLMRSFKRIAKSLGIVVILLSQLNRAADVLKENEAPRLSHLRESGSIEQAADIVLFLWRPNKGMEGVDPSRVDDHGLLSIAKNRNGGLGQVKLAWNGPSFSYSEWLGSVDPEGVYEFPPPAGEWP